MWVRVGLGIGFLGLVVAFAVGLFAEAAILVATIVVCSLSVVPLVVDRRVLRRLDPTSVTCGSAPLPGAYDGMETDPPIPISLPSGSRKVTFRTAPS